jgi:nucleotide-binding universal stress UspA family protein
MRQSIPLEAALARAYLRGSMSRPRRSYESGHKPKYLVVIDDSAECDRAVYYASRRSARNAGGLVMLRVVDTKDRNQQWLGVADIMRAEAHEEAQEVLARFAARAKAISGVTAEQVIREGETAAEILNHIEEDEDIAILVLAAGVGNEGPGPLVAELSTTAATFPVPIAIVPGHLGDQDLDAMT